MPFDNLRKKLNPDAARFESDQASLPTTPIDESIPSIKPAPSGLWNDLKSKLNVNTIRDVGKYLLDDGRAGENAPQDEIQPDYNSPVDFGAGALGGKFASKVAPGIVRDAEQILSNEVGALGDKVIPKGVDTSKTYYHGTTAPEIKEFNPHRGDKTVFVSPEPEFANSFAGVAPRAASSQGTVYPVHLGVKNTFDYENPKHIKKLIKEYPGLLNDESNILHNIKNGDWQAIEDPSVLQGIKDMGFDSVHIQEDGTKNIAVFDPNNIYSKFAQKADALPAKEEWAPTFYSKLQNLVKEKMGTTATPQQVEGMVNGGGIKAEEVKWLKLKEYLEGKSSVDKNELVKHLESNMPQITDIIRGEGGTKTNQALAEYTKALKQNGFKEGDEIFRNAIADARNAGGDGNNVPDSLRELAEQVRRTERMNRVQFGPESHPNVNTPGGTNYREVLSTLPERKAENLLPVDVDAESKLEAIRNEMQPLDRKIAKVYDDFYQSGGQSEGATFEHLIKQGLLDGNDVERARVLRDDYNKLQSETNHINGVNQERNENVNYRGAHWKEPNVLVHQRNSDRLYNDGKSGIHSDEIQSDWIHAGIKDGFAPEVKATDDQLYEANLKLNRMMHEQQVPNQSMLEKYAALNSNPEYIETMKLRDALEAKRASMSGPGIPDAPFKNTYQELALKKLLREAAEKDKDRITWATGQQHADRYDLSTKVDNIFLQSQGNGKYIINATPKGSTEITNIAKEVPHNQLSDYIGKDLASKVDPTIPQYNFDNQDLNVGGEWHKKLYDKKHPEFLDKFGKQYGVKSGEAIIPTEEGSIGVIPNKNGTWSAHDIDTPDAPGVVFKTQEEAREYQKQRGGRKVHSFELTPQMKADILKKGFPLWLVPLLGSMPDGPSSSGNPFSQLTEKLRGGSGV